MNMYTRQKTYLKLLEYYEIYSIENDYDRKLYESRLLEFVDELYDLSKDAVAPLTARETYIFRNQYGILGYNVHKFKDKLSRELGITKTAINQIINQIYKNIPFRIKKQEVKYSGYTVFDVFTNKKNLSEMALGELNISASNIRKLMRHEVFTLHDLMQYSSRELYTLVGSKGSASSMIINEIHTLGLRFIDEISDREKRALFVNDNNPNKIMNTNISWLVLSEKTENEFKDRWISKIRDLRITGIKNRELNVRLKQLGISNISSFAFERDGIDKVDSNLEETKARALKMSVDILHYNGELSARAHHILRRNGITNMEGLIALTTIQLSEIRNLGIKSYREILDKVHEYGLRFADEKETERQIKGDISTTIAEEKLSSKDTDELSDEEKQLLISPIDILGLSPRTYNILRRAEILAIEELVALSTSHLSRVRGVGEMAYQEIMNKVHAFNLKFSDEEDVDLDNWSRKVLELSDERDSLLARGTELDTEINGILVELGVDNKDNASVQPNNPKTKRKKK